MTELRDRRGGGTGNAGGTDLHALATVLVAAHMLQGSPIGWLDGVVEDIAVSVEAETKGDGDDIGMTLLDGSKVEVQSKKRLTKGKALWEALDALFAGIEANRIAYGVLVVSIDASETIRLRLAKDMVAIGQGRTDDLSEVGKEWLKRLEDSGRNPAHCAKMRIVTLYFLDGDSADKRSTLQILRDICLEPDRAPAAFDRLYREAVGLQKNRGRWTVSSLVRLLRSSGIEPSASVAVADMAGRLSEWAAKVYDGFQLPAGVATLPFDAMVPAYLAPVQPAGSEGWDVEEALERYHRSEIRSIGERRFNGEWTGRFKRLNMVVAGPGSGKSTLARRVAWEFASDGVPVLFVRLESVAKAMKFGATFQSSLLDHGLDGSGISPEQFLKHIPDRFVVVGDGLDEAEELHDTVAQGLASFEKGYPAAVVVVTTRPIGYETTRLSSWVHYHLTPPNEGESTTNLARILSAVPGWSAGPGTATAIAKRELDSTVAKSAIASSPFMLAMAASLIIRHRRLPQSKTDLYEAMIALFEQHADLPGVPRSHASRVLDILGWELLDDPLSGFRQIQTRVCERLATDLGCTTLAAADVFEQAVVYWSKAGIVERLHHSGQPLLTFAHKTFVEFTAARFVMNLPPERRLELLRNLVDEPKFTEVTAFAGGMGLGNDLADYFIRCDQAGVPEQIERALALAADHDVAVDDDKIRQLASIAFGMVAQDRQDRYALGVALESLSGTRPSVLRPLTLERLDDPCIPVAITAWACAIAAECAFDPSGLRRLSAEFGAFVAGSRPARGGLQALRSGPPEILVRKIAIHALGLMDREEALDFVEKELTVDPFRTHGFSVEVRASLAAKGIGNEVLKKSPTTSVHLMENLLIPTDYHEHGNKVARDLARAASSFVPERSGPARHWLNFGAVYELMGIGSAVAGDVYEWPDDVDVEGLREMVRGMTHVVGINTSELANEAADILDVLGDNLDQRMVFFDLPSVDFEDPDWTLARGIDLSRSAIERIFLQLPVSMAMPAANMLAGLPADEIDLARLLADAHDQTLIMASRVVQHSTDDATWRRLVEDRLRAGVGDVRDQLLAELASNPKTSPTE